MPRHGPTPKIDGQLEPAVIDPLLASRLEPHKGRWVAIDESTGDVVGVGDSAADVQRLALAHHVTDPLIFRVPTHPERLNFLGVRVLLPHRRP